MVCIDRRKIKMLGYRETNYTDTISDTDSIEFFTEDIECTYTITITNTNTDEIIKDWDYEIKQTRSGWNNPQKIGNPISAKTIFKNNMIRNRLHRNKLRINELVN